MHRLLLLTVSVLMCVEPCLSLPADCPTLKIIIPECDCTSPTDLPDEIVIYCKGKGLTSMPVINGSYNGVIYEFTLANNDIEYLPDNAFQGLNVQRVDLTQNKLTNISEVAFQGLETSLLVLKIGGTNDNSPQTPLSAIKNLRELQELFLQNLVLPSVHLDNSSYFQPFSKLLTLTLDNLGIQSIGSQAFLGLTSLKEIHIKHSLTTYPGNAFRDVMNTIETISVTNTRIQSVMYYSFNEFSKLRKVDLSYNEITELEEECFKGVENSLESLILDNNNIPQDQLEEIRQLTALKVLSLQNIHLSVLSQNSTFLHNKNNLLELKLARNVLTTVPDNTFRGLTSLTKLELSLNDLQTMSDVSLAGLSSLQTLNLDNQRSSSLALPLMSTLTALRTLDLDYTVITTPSWTRLRDATSLRTLSMTKGQIYAIPPFTFQKMTSLENLYLSSNQISNIDQETFVGPRHTLKQVHLNHNNITSFDLCTFSNYSVNVSLELYQNPLRCDCGLSWLLDAVNSGKVILSELNVCASPSSLNGRKFTSLTPSDLCRTEPDVPTCSDFYSTTTSTTTAEPTTTAENIVINVVATEVIVNSVTISWTINKPVDNVKVVHTENQKDEENTSRPLDPFLEDYTITDLKPGTRYLICVDALRGGKVIKKECISQTTKTITSTPASTSEPMSNNEEIGIIIGSVVGGLLLLAILVAIIYLMVIRKKPPKDKYAVEPRNFKKAELPTTGYDSKRYRKKKKDETDGNKNNVNVTVISDGRTAPGRTSTGSYQYLQDNKGVSARPNPSYENDAVGRANYENDQSLRPLPHMPRDSAGYYTHSPNYSTDQPHMYSEIKL